MKITNLWQANFLSWLYLHTPIGYLIEKHFSVKYLSGSDGVFMEINKKGKDYGRKTYGYCFTRSVRILTRTSHYVGQYPGLFYLVFRVN